MRGRKHLELMNSQHQIKLTIKKSDRSDRPRQGGHLGCRSRARDTSTPRDGTPFSATARAEFDLIGDGGPAKGTAFRRTARCSSQ